jgi:hydroxymethylbilane synthase
METREGDGRVNKILEPVNHQATALCAAAEREVLCLLDGTCHTPISAFATLDGQNLTLQAQVYSLDGQEKYEASATIERVTIETAKEVGEKLGRQLLEEMPEGFLE